MTILNWSFPRKDISRSAQAYQLALALRDEVADLEAAGCKVIQVQAAAVQALLLCHIIALHTADLFCFCVAAECIPELSSMETS